MVQKKTTETDKRGEGWGCDNEQRGICDREKAFHNNPYDMNRATKETKVTGLILAGGKSTRFGQDKACVNFGGTTLLGYIFNMLRELFDEVIIVGGRYELAKMDNERIVEDIYPGSGPLGGIHAGLINAQNDRCFVTACDAPFLEKKLIRFICAFTDTDVAIPRSVNGKLHPLTAVYVKSCIPAIEKQLHLGHNKIIDFFPMVMVRYVEETDWRWYDPEGRSFININTMEDYLLNIKT